MVFLLDQAARCLRKVGDVESRHLRPIAMLQQIGARRQAETLGKAGEVGRKALHAEDIGRSNLAVPCCSEDIKMLRDHVAVLERWPGCPALQLHLQPMVELSHGSRQTPGPL